MNADKSIADWPNNILKKKLTKEHIMYSFPFVCRYHNRCLLFALIYPNIARLIP